MFVYKDNLVCLQSQSPRDASPQSFHSLPPGDSELDRAAGCGDDGQTHSGLTGGDLSPAGCRATREKAAEPRRLVHSSKQDRFRALRFLSLAAAAAVTFGRCVKTPQAVHRRPRPLERKANQRQPDEPSTGADQSQRPFPHLVTRHAPFIDDAICTEL